MFCTLFNAYEKMLQQGYATLPASSYPA